MRTQQTGFTLIEIVIVVAIVTILATTALLQYQTYTISAQVTRVMYEASNLRSNVEICILNGKTTIGTTASECNPQATGSTLLNGMSQIGIVLPTGTGVPQVANLGANATITATFGNSANTSITAQTLTWSRNSDGIWSCTTTVNTRYKPLGCL